MRDNGRMGESAQAGVQLSALDGPRWKCQWHLQKDFVTDSPSEGYRAGEQENIWGDGNALLIGGASLIWERIITNDPSTSATGAALQSFSTDNANLVVSTSTAAAVNTQTWLQGSTQHYSTMESGYPAHTDATTSTAAQSAQFRAIYGTTEANITWNEWGLCSFAASSGGRMLNRKVQSLGAKTSAATWTFTASLSLA